MPMPVNEKTWAHDTNNHVNTGVLANDMKEILLGIKNALVAGGWVVRRSSDSVAVSNDDRWDDVSKLVWNTTGNRSWIVLRNAALADGEFDLLLECRWSSSGYPSHLQLYVAAEGYNLATGTTNAIPTANVDQHVVLFSTAAAVPIFISTTLTDKYWNVSVSVDRECTRVWVFQGGLCTTFLLIDKMKNPVAGLATKDKWMVGFVNNGGTAVTHRVIRATFHLYAGVTDSSTGMKTYVAGQGPAGYACTGEAIGTATSATSSSLLTEDYIAVNPDDGNGWPLMPIGLSTKQNVGWAYGRNGELFDIWWGNATLAHGSTYPGTGEKSLIQIGCFVLPWDGSVPSIT